MITPGAPLRPTPKRRWIALPFTALSLLVAPQIARGADDLSMPADLALGGDLATAPDLAKAPDLATPPDLVKPTDLAKAPADLTTPADLAMAIDLAKPSPDLGPPPDLTLATADLAAPVDLEAEAGDLSPPHDVAITYSSDLANSGPIGAKGCSCTVGDTPRDGSGALLAAGLIGLALLRRRASR